MVKKAKKTHCTVYVTISFDYAIGRAQLNRFCIPSVRHIFLVVEEETRKKITPAAPELPKLNFFKKQKN